MPRFSVKIENLAKFEEQMRRSPVVFAKHLQLGITKATLLFLREVKDNIRKGTDMWKAPIDTGVMVNTIYPIITTLRGEIIPQADYAPYVHEGTKFMRARPFLEITERTTQEAITQVFHDEFEAAVTEIA